MKFERNLMAFNANNSQYANFSFKINCPNNRLRKAEMM